MGASASGKPQVSSSLLVPRICGGPSKPIHTHAHVHTQHTNTHYITITQRLAV